MYALISIGVLIVPSVVILLKSNHIVRNLRIFINFVFYLISTAISLFMIDSFWSIVMIVLLFALECGLLYLLYKPGIVFDDFRIYNLAYFKNKSKQKSKVESSYRCIGNLVPQDYRELKNNNAMVTQSQSTATRHTLVSGKNGAGKTYLIKSLVRQDIAKGRSVIYADYKGSQNDANHLLTYAKERGYELYVLHNGLGDFNYDPMRNINNAARIESFMNSTDWSEPYYKRQTQLFLNKTIPLYSRIFDKNHKDRNINFLRGYNEFLKEYKYNKDERDGMSGVQDLLDLMLESSTGDIYGHGLKKLDFRKLIESKNKYMIVILFDSNLKDTATSFSAVLYSDLLYCYNNYNDGDVISVYADESSALKNVTIMDDLVARGRSAGLSVLMSFQSLNQISYNAGEEYLNFIVENINSSIIFPGTSNDIAKKISGLGWGDETFNIQTLKTYEEKGISPTIFYSSDQTGLPNDKKKRYVLQPYIYDVESEKKDVEDFISKISHNNSKAMKEFMERANKHKQKVEEPENLDVNGNSLSDKTEPEIKQAKRDDVESVDFSDLI